MWIIETVKDKESQEYNQARCYACGYTMNTDLFTRDDLTMIMEAHKCK